jgi:DHA2 family multidrug resistance protein-like MFS transporter
MQGMARLSGQTAGSVLLLVLFGLIAAERAPHLGLGIGALFAFIAGIISMLKIAR